MFIFIDLTNVNRKNKKNNIKLSNFTKNKNNISMDIFAGILVGVGVFILFVGQALVTPPKTTKYHFSTYDGDDEEMRFLTEMYADFLNKKESKKIEKDEKKGCICYIIGGILTLIGALLFIFVV